MILATIEQFDDIVNIFKKQKKIFPHIRLDYIRSMIQSNRCIFQDGIVIMFNQYKRCNRLGEVVAPKDSYTIKQIVNSSIGNGNAQKVLDLFLSEIKNDVYLSVRADNSQAIRFYLRNEFLYMGSITWKNGRIYGHVYCRKYSNI